MAEHPMKMAVCVPREKDWAAGVWRKIDKMGDKIGDNNVAKDRISRKFPIWPYETSHEKLSARADASHGQSQSFAWDAYHSAGSLIPAEAWTFGRKRWLSWLRWLRWSRWTDDSLRCLQQMKYETFSHPMPTLALPSAWLTMITIPSHQTLPYHAPWSH